MSGLEPKVTAKNVNCGVGEKVSNRPEADIMIQKDKLKKLSPMAKTFTHASLFLVSLLAATVVYAQDSLEGVWEAQKVVDEAGETPIAYGPNLLIFTRDYFSKLESLANRPTVTKPGTPLTDEEKVSAYDTYRSNGGTYERTESTIVFHTLVVRSPRTGAVGWTYENDYHFEGDKLILTEASPRGLETTTYARLE